MDIDKMREIIAYKLGYTYNLERWDDILQDTDPGHYGTEDVHIEVSPGDIWVNVPTKSFSFKNANLSFSARLGGSSDKNGFDENFTLIVSGNGNFDFTNNSQDIEVEDFSINEPLHLYGEE